MTWTAFWPSLVALLLGAAVPATPPQRIAILIFAAAPADAGLADNLTEIAISQLAGRGDRELVGTREFRRLLERVGSKQGMIGCSQDVSCLRRAAGDLAIGRVVTGILRRQDAGIVIALTLIDAATGTTERHLERASRDATEPLVHAMKDGIEALFAPRPSPARLQVHSVPGGAVVVLDDRHLGRTPLVAESIDSGPHHVRVEMTGRLSWKKDVVLSAGQSMAIALTPEDLPPRRRWAPHVAYGSAALGLISLAGAGIFGTLARAEPSGPTRADAQRDLGLRDVYATTSNGLWIAGGVFVATSIATFLWLWRDVTSE